MENRLNWEDFKDMFHPSWKAKMKKAIESEWMFEIYAKIKEDAKKERILPNSDDTFKSFEICDLKGLKSVWYCMDPYPRVYRENKLPQATGIPMSCDNSPDGRLQPSLEKFYDGLEKDLGKKVERNVSLKYLLGQGVLLLNTDLTVKLGKTSSHAGLWEPFQKYLLEDMLFGTTGIVYVLCGKESWRMEKYINPLGNHIFKIEHPVAASYKNTDWNCQKIFTKTNKILESNGGPLNRILWNKADYDDTDLPF